MSHFDQKTRTWAMACHLVAFLAFFGIPLVNIWGPLLIWNFGKDKSPFIDYHGKQAMNFQLSLIVIILPLFFLAFVPFINLLVIPAGVTLLGYAVVNMVRAGMAARDGILFRYPHFYEFIKS